MAPSISDTMQSLESCFEHIKHIYQKKSARLSSILATEFVSPTFGNAAVNIDESRNNLRGKKGRPEVRSSVLDDMSHFLPLHAGDMIMGYK